MSPWWHGRSVLHLNQLKSPKKRWCTGVNFAQKIEEKQNRGGRGTDGGLATVTQNGRDEGANRRMLLRGVREEKQRWQSRYDCDAE